MKHELLHTEDSRRALCTELQEKGKKEMLKLQQKWKQDEHKRLTLIAKQRTSALKKQAAKALEPELRRIVQEHKDELQRKRQEIELDLKTTKEQLQINSKNRFAQKKREIEAEERQLIHQTDEDYGKKIKELEIEHEKKIGEMQKKTQGEVIAAKASRKALMQQKTDAFKASIVDKQNQNRRQIDEAKKLIQSEIQNHERISDEELRKVMKNQEV